MLAEIRSCSRRVSPVPFVLSALTLFGCTDPGCPSGSSKVGGQCVAEAEPSGAGGADGSDAGPHGSRTASSTEAQSASPTAGAGGANGAAPSNPSSNAPRAGSAASGSGNRANQSSAGNGGGTMSSGGAGANSMSADMQAGADASGGSSGAAAPCEGHAGENVCDGAVLHKCSDTGTSSSSDACMSEALCQVGVVAGVCAVCNPGTFQCDGAKLNVCTAEGQYTLQETCASAALCSADAGACTTMKCMPNTTSCSSDGSSLRTCNADGSDFANQEPCNGKGCNAAMKQCNTCMPGAKSCAGGALAICNPDGQTMAMMPCMPTNGECGTATCQTGGQCMQGRKPAGSACSKGKCDAAGMCVACIAASDCPDKGPCMTKTCTGGVCGGNPKPAGTMCGTGMACDGADKCEKLCGNGVVDVDQGEQCDKTASGWEGSGNACDSSCKLTASVYQLCDNGGSDCWPNSLAAGWFCSAVGMCTRACGTATDCRAAGVSPACSTVAGGRACSIPCTGDSMGRGNCSVGQCQWYGKRATTAEDLANLGSIPRMCGWISSDPGMANAPWCPGELPGTECCSPGGRCISEAAP
jgi:hypothetical protein